MFLSKIWFFLVAIAAAVALTFALVMPRPAERRAVENEESQLRHACKISSILLKENARIRVQLAGEFGRTGAPKNEPSLRLGSILFGASKGELVSSKENATGRTALERILNPKVFSGTPPDFVLLLDRRGRVVARRNKSGENNDKYGESLRGYHLVDDVLAGYLRDDLWVVDGKLFRVAGSPVVTNNADWAGAVVLGHAVDDEFAESVSTGLDVAMSFYTGGGAGGGASGAAVASSNNAAINKDVASRASKLEALEPGTDCDKGEIFAASAGDKTYSVILSRLPGEAGELGAFSSVFVERKTGRGFFATVGSLKKGDLSFSSFPWISVILLFLVMAGIGLFLMIWEADRPLKRISDDAQRLSKGGDKLVEEQHRGKFGSVARSVNVALDRLRREAKSAQKDLDDLLGPAPAAGGSPLPAMGPSPMAPPPPPPPSEFRFSDAPMQVPATIQQPAPMQQQAMHHQPMAAPPLNLPVPPPPAAAQSAPVQLPTDVPVVPRPVSLPGAPPLVAPVEVTHDSMTVQRANPIIEDMPTIVSQESEQLARDDAETMHFRQIYEEFLATKRQCGESAENLNFERFSNKLRKNRDALIARHGCASVRFQVYVKDGKAALKASPER